MEMDNASSRTLKVLKKERSAEMAMEKFWGFVWESSKISEIGLNSVLY